MAPVPPPTEPCPNCGGNNWLEVSRLGRDLKLAPMNAYRCTMCSALFARFSPWLKGLGLIPLLFFLLLLQGFFWAVAIEMPGWIGKNFDTVCCKRCYEFWQIGETFLMDEQRIKGAAKTWIKSFGV